MVALSRSYMDGGSALPAEWVRNPEWLAMPSVITGDKKFAGLMAIFDQEHNYRRLTAAGNYTVDWGDGSATENINSGVAATHDYDYEDSDLIGTDVGYVDAVACTFTDSGDKVNLTAHRWSNGQKVMFTNIVSTTGISEDTRYFIVNANANDFQVSATIGGSALTLTTDGSGEVFVPKYRQVVITVVPQAGQSFTSINTAARHASDSGVPEAGWLDMVICGSGLTTISLRDNTLRHSLVERIRIIDHNKTSYADTFTSHYGLQSVEIQNTGSVTSFSGTFSGCGSLVYAPELDTSSCTNMASMFNTCWNLRVVPEYDTSIVTNMSSMFTSCFLLEEIPLFDTSAVTNVTSMMSNCYSLLEFPAFDFSLVTAGSSLLTSCSGLETVPWLDLNLNLHFSQVYGNCYNLVSLPDQDMSAATTSQANTFAGLTKLKYLGYVKCGASTGASMFSACSSLASIRGDFSALTATTSMFASCSALASIEGPMPAISFSVASCALGPEALDRIYTNLPTVVGQTITVTGNYGTSGDDPTIATAKGWTVTS